MVALTIVQLGVAHAQDTTLEAKQAFEAGVQAFDAGNYGDALGHFERANALRPHPLVRVNIANCYVKLGDPLEALSHFEAFLASGEGQPEQRSEVQAEVERLLLDIGSAELLVSPEGATVRIDGGEALTAPVGGVQRLTPGRHRIEVALEGYAPYAGHFTTRRGEKVTVQVALQPAVIVPPDTPMGGEDGEDGEDIIPPLETVETPEQAEESGEAGAPWFEVDAEADDSGRRGLSLRSWIAVAGTGVLLATSIVTGIAALAADDDFQTNAQIANDPAASARLRQEAWRLGRDAHDTAVLLAGTTDVLLLGALVGGGLSAYFIYDDLGGGERAAGLRVTPLAGRDGGGLAVGGHF